MNEVILVASSALVLLITGALVAFLMLKVQMAAQAPLIAMLRQQQKYIISNDLQVYQGVLLAENQLMDPEHPRAAPMPSNEELITQEELDRQMDAAFNNGNRIDGYLDPVAEPS
jgi:hypothetical protein